MLNLKDPKTTTVAIIVGIISLVLVGALIMHQIDVSSFGAAIGTVGSTGGVVIGYFAADSKQSPPPAV
jgi:hypothetical protein